jgi:serpin B
MLESANNVIWEEENGLRERTHLKFANSVWLDIGAELNEDYEEVVGDYVLQTDFESTNSSTAVNSWVKENTNGLIDAIVPPDEPLSPAKLLAINSIYLKARWLGDLFEAYNTNLDTFYASPSRSTKVSEAHFMHTVDDFFYSHDALKGYQTIKLPLLMGGSMSMIFVLPQTDGGKAVKSMDLIDALDSLESRNVALALPKFNFKSTYEDDLMEALIALGLDSLFTDSDSLCGLLEDSECLFISKVIQKTSIAVDEEGVEAAAATAVTLMGSAIPSRELPISMMLDHPFQFFIYDEEEKLMLFEGRLGAPEVPKEEPSTPLLDAKHSDADFWVSHFGRQVAEAPVPSASSPPLQYW